MLDHPTLATAIAFALGGGFGGIVGFVIRSGQVGQLRETVGRLDATLEARLTGIVLRDKKIANYDKRVIEQIHEIDRLTKQVKALEADAAYGRKFRTSQPKATAASAAKRAAEKANGGIAVS